MFVCLLFSVLHQNGSFKWRRQYPIRCKIKVYARHLLPLSLKGSLSCHIHLQLHVVNEFPASSEEPLRFSRLVLQTRGTKTYSDPQGTWKWKIEIWPTCISCMLRYMWNSSSVSDDGSLNELFFVHCVWR